MDRYFPHEQLEVYGVALEYAGFAGQMLGSWPSLWAAGDHFDRATESVLINMAKAARFRASPKGVFFIECSLGSVLECAACIDVAFLRHIVEDRQVHTTKKMLQQIARMSVGLRTSWENCVMEESAPYGKNSCSYFLHESLDVYQSSLQMHKELDKIWENEKLRKRHIKRLDELSTGLSLNIAEGNGRFSALDHSKFIDIAENAGTKLACYLDMVEVTSHVRFESAKKHLRDVMAMLSGMHRHLRDC